jgi:glycerol-3-phosphate O-acyltransferase
MAMAMAFGERLHSRESIFMPVLASAECESSIRVEATSKYQTLATAHQNAQARRRLEEIPLGISTTVIESRDLRRSACRLFEFGHFVYPAPALRVDHSF